MARITAHGRKRAKERMGLPRRAVSRTIDKVISSGKPRTAFTGQVRKYLDTLWMKGQMYGTKADVIVYGANIFLVAGDYLVTTWPMPQRWRNGKVARFKENFDEEFEYEEG